MPWKGYRSSGFLMGSIGGQEITHFSRERNKGGDQVGKEKQFELPTGEVRLPTSVVYDGNFKTSI